jgi:molybdopterin-guanine dinucleotide biosynthesis protein A
MTGIVLAGGKCGRMGTDKAFLTVAGMPMIAHVVRALRTIADQIIIVTNSPAAYAAFDAVIVTDALVKPGPLTGIYSGLQTSKDECNFIVACDMPYLNPQLLSYMSGLAEGYDIVAPKVGGFVEPLHAIYRRRLLPVIEDRIQRDVQRIQAIFSEARVRFVPEEDIDRFDPARRSFKNLNTPQEYKEATCLD